MRSHFCPCVYVPFNFAYGAYEITLFSVSIFPSLYISPNFLKLRILWYHLNVCVSPNSFFVFYVVHVDQRKIDD
jgi:hypothetical protein